MADERIAANGSDTHDAFVTEREQRTSGANSAAGKQMHKHTARMPTERHASDYNMNHKNRGLALIFNHKYFDELSLNPRCGTNVDCENLSKALKQLDFNVNVYKDSKLQDINKQLKKAASQDHSDSDCIVIVILSHGEHGYIYAKDTKYSLDTILNYFTELTCPTLAGKPKIFIIQACQGRLSDPGILLEKTETDGESSISFKMPIHPDFLFAYSTIPGFYSFRNTTSGSWFIQSLVEELNNNGKKYDILTLLTFVNQRVAIDFESNMPGDVENDQKKQIPCVTSMLTRILRFTDKNTKSG